MSTSNLNNYEQMIFGKWLDMYKKSATMYLVLSGLKEGEKWSKELHEYIHTKLSDGVSIDERSMYRILRKLDGLDLVQFTKKAVSRTGAKRKIFSLTENGHNLQKAMQQNYSSLA